MRRTSLVLFALALAACDGDPVSPDAGPPDAGPSEADTGPGGPDAGAASLCGDALPTPTAWDCASSEPSITFGEPIVAEDRVWTWVPFDDALCMDGSSTGIGVSLSSTSDRVMILLEGGGACFDAISCAGAANPDGFDEAKFATYDRLLTSGIFDRDDPASPVADWSFVYIPYCTGDVHGGTNPSAPGGRTHVGYRNMTAYLSRLVPTFSSASQVLLAGRSAGGLGTLVNFSQVQEAFDCTPVHVLDDAGAVLPEPYLRPCLQQQVRERWGLDAIVPSDCPECTCEDGSGLWKVFGYLARRFPAARIGLATAVADSTFRQFYGYGYSPGCNFPQQMPAADYEAGLNVLRAALASEENARTFYVPGTQHTFTYDRLSETSVGGVSLATWVGQLVEGDAAWADVGP